MGLIMKASIKNTDTQKQPNKRSRKINENATNKVFKSFQVKNTITI